MLTLKEYNEISSAVQIAKRNRLIRNETLRLSHALEAHIHNSACSGNPTPPEFCFEFSDELEKEFCVDIMRTAIEDLRDNGFTINITEPAKNWRRQTYSICFVQ